MSMKMQVGLAAIVSMWAAEGRPCSDAVLDLSTVVVPFEGHTVPRNATLDVLSPSAATGELVGPDDVVRRVSWSNLGAEITPPLDDGGLVPGRYTLTLRFPEDFGDPSSRSIVFGVEDRVDTDGAPVTFSVTRRTGGDPPWAVSMCTNTPWPTTFATISLDESVDEDEIAWVEIGPNERRFSLVDGAVEVVEDAGTDLDQIVAIDFAGNRSEPAGLIDADSGCGCTSADAPTFAGIVGLLALLRRRRR